MAEPATSTVEARPDGFARVAVRHGWVAFALQADESANGDPVQGVDDAVAPDALEAGREADAELTNADAEYTRRPEVAELMDEHEEAQHYGERRRW